MTIPAIKIDDQIIPLGAIASLGNLEVNNAQVITSEIKKTGVVIEYNKFTIHLNNGTKHTVKPYMLNSIYIHEADADKLVDDSEKIRSIFLKIKDYFNIICIL